MAWYRLTASALPMPPTTSKIPHLLVAISTKQAQRVLHFAPPPPRRHTTSSSPSSSSSSSFRHPTLPLRPPTPTSSPDLPSSRARPLKPYFWAISLFGAAIGLYLSYYFASYRTSVKRATSLSLPQNADVSNRWDDAGRDFDEEIEFSEKAMFMGRKRRRLLGGENVRGRLLEVSCGTGRNFGYYDFDGKREGAITELVFNDQSAVQLGIARGKWQELQAERRKRGRLGAAFDGKVKGVVGDAGVRGVIRRPEGGFDTIVQTMGVCSMQDPVGFLRRMNYLVRQPGEETGDKNDEGGRILLLEHGKGYYEWINRFLDNGAVMHADRYGCWFNKDISEVLRESGLRVERVKRYHLGTTWEVVLRPNSELLRREDVPVNITVKEKVSGKGKSWWSWL